LEDSRPHRDRTLFACSAAGPPFYVAACCSVVPFLSCLAVSRAGLHYVSGAVPTKLSRHMGSCSVRSGRGLWFEGPLGGISEDNPQWALESSSKRESFSHSNCIHFGMRGDEAYILRIRVRDVDPRSPHTSLIPTLEWGGVECYLEGVRPFRCPTLFLPKHSPSIMI